ncbi:MAG: hypothetical protein AB7I25_00250 [Vicinamibacterales bacterium]
MPIRVLVALLLACAVTVLTAATPAVWQAAGAAEFLKGDLENLAVDARGRLTLAPASTVLHDPAVPFVWSLVEGANGVLYAGTGNDGQVLAVEPSARSRVLFDADQLEVHALAPAPGGGVYVGTSPDGAVFKVDAAGKAQPFFDPPDTYIWSLAVAPSGDVFVATGDQARVYKVTPAGASSTFYAAKAAHAMSLAFDAAGRLVVGTESPGRVIQLDAAGKPFVLIDSPHTDVHSLRLGPDGALYAVAASAKPAPAGAAPKPAAATSAPAPAAGTATVTVEVTAVAVPADASAPAPASPAAGNPADGSGAIYRIQPDGLWDTVWDVKGDVPYDVAVEPDGALLVATGSRGRLYRLRGNPAEASLVTRQKAQHLTALLRTRAGAMVYATSNPGRILRLDAAPAAAGTYESDVRDAQSVSTWGVIRWRATTPAGARVQVATRTGNTQTPDETWSDWSSPYATPAGSAIASPKARYLQWRVALAGQGDPPVLTSVAASYLPRNARPVVAAVTVHPPGVVFQRPYPSGDPDLAGYDLEPPARKALAAGSPKEAVQLGKKAYEHGLLTLQWRAEDSNGDDLEFDVQYRREGDADWTLLRRRLTEALTVWDTASVPDGTYTLRVVASDAPSNPAGAALTGFLDSGVVDIDNTAPTIAATGVRRNGTRTVITIEARDAASPLRAVEYTVDGQRWLPLYARDGLIDSREETVELTLDAGQEQRTIVVRATDALNNAGSGTVTAASAGTPSGAPPQRR